jgi:meso-butanediol dehydrogenase/(S,S)-butanediol dehydrogenase/diacetyl reductase
MSGVEGKVIVVTGGAAGLGRACLNAFAASGARVVMGDIDAEAGTEAVSGLGSNARFLPCDVTSAADCAALVASALANFGRLDALMSNAGIGANGTVETCDEANWDRVIGVNLKGMFLMAKFAVPHLRAAGGGAIVNTASVSGMWGEPDTVAYNASKGGVIGLTRAMAMDLARDRIRVNALCPGYHATGMPAAYFAAHPQRDEMVRRVNDLIPLRRMGEPDELARVAEFLLSDASSFMTGTVLVSDGGMTAGYPWYPITADGH